MSRIKYFKEMLKANEGEMLIFSIAVITVGIIIVRLVTLCLFDYHGIKDAEAYRTIGVTESSEMRGSIYDRNGNTLAACTPSYNLVFSPFNICECEEKSDLLEELNKTHSSKKRAELEDKIEELEIKSREKAEKIAHILTYFDEDASAEEVVKTIMIAAGVEESDSKDSDEISSGYYVVLYNIDESAKNSINDFFSNYNNDINKKRTEYYEEKAAKEKGIMGKLSSLFGDDDEGPDLPLKITLNEDYYFETKQKRIYPYNQTASLMLGYVNDYGVALTGLETYYDTELSGVADRRVTGKGVFGIITSVFDKEYEGKASVNLQTTIDVNIQQILEKEITKTQKNTNAESVYAVVMKTKTGEILAMGNTPGYNPSDPDEPNETELNYYKYLAENKKEEETEEETEDPDVLSGSKSPLAVIEEEGSKKEETPTCGTVFERTNNRSIVSPFYPGSVYKAFLVSGALEEGMDVNYYCGGSFTIPDSATYAGGANRTIGCALGASHGMCNAEYLLVNSCNICAAQLGLDMGSDTFFKYYQAFGFTEKTGIDLPGGNTDPGSALYYSEYDTTSLATCSFGQNNKMSTLQLALAMSAIGNGGKLMTPYVVAEQVDSDGNVVSKTEPTVKRQVISEAVANTVAGYLESVINKGSGSKAKLDHYRVSGKTGTSQIKDSNEVTIGYVASFAGFAPTSDPEITVVVNIIDPKFENGTYSEILASDIAAPLAGEILGQSLEYLGIAYDK